MLSYEQQLRVESLERRAMVCLDSDTPEKFRKWIEGLSRSMSLHVFAEGGGGIGYAYRFSDADLSAIRKCEQKIAKVIAKAEIIERPGVREAHAAAIAAAKYAPLQAFLSKVSNGA